VKFGCLIAMATEVRHDKAYTLVGRSHGMCISLERECVDSEVSIMVSAETHLTNAGYYTTQSLSHAALLINL